jgi:hypothetical protein
MKPWVRRTLIGIVGVGLPLRLAVAIADGSLKWPTLPAESATDRIEARTDGVDGRASVTLLSRTHTLDRIYQSMQGPFSNHAAVRLVNARRRPELLWLTGARVDVVGADARSPVSREFFCHGNVTFTPDQLSPRRGDGPNAPFTPMPDLRLFTLVPGRLALKFPDGFGVPVYSDEPLDCFSMSLNLNVTGHAQDVRFRTRLDYVRDDAPAGRGMKPLFRRAIYGFEPIGRQSPYTVCHGAAHPGAACGSFVGTSASGTSVGSVSTTNTIHWLVPPGHYESRVPVTDQLDLAEDTTAHYVTGHLHPFGRSIRLVDATEDRTVFAIASKDFGDRLGVAEMDELVLPDGLALRKGHEYQLITTYFNPTDKPIDVMSILYIYALDTRFARDGGAARPEPVAMRR